MAGRKRELETGGLTGTERSQKQNNKRTEGTSQEWE